MKIDISKYKPPKRTPKKYISNPCAECGWNADQAIHTNPQLIGKGGPYHEYVARAPEPQEEQI